MVNEYANPLPLISLLNVNVKIQQAVTIRVSANKTTHFGVGEVYSILTNAILCNFATIS